MTTTDRGWPNHVPVVGDTGLTSASWAMTEQVRTISRHRIDRVSGAVSGACMGEIRMWLADFLDLYAEQR